MSARALEAHVPRRNQENAVTSATVTGLPDSGAAQRLPLHGGVQVALQQGRAWEALEASTTAPTLCTDTLPAAPEHCLPHDRYSRPLFPLGAKG